MLEVLASLYVADYYASMAVAWAYASAWGKFPEKTKKYLTSHSVDRKMYRRTLQKCLESYRVGKEDKEWIRKERGRY